MNSTKCSEHIILEKESTLHLGCNIITEESMNVHFLQGNFFQNFGSIILFAVVGTLISALIVGGGVYLLGQVSFVHTCIRRIVRELEIMN